MSELGKAFRDAVKATDPLELYKRSHGAEVVTQNDDDTVELACDTKEIGHVPSVPLRVGIPTARVLVEEGTRVRLAFENGNPEAPYAYGIAADAEADKGVARESDLVDMGKLSIVSSVGDTLLWYHPDFPEPPHTSPVTIAAVPIPIEGRIKSGSAKVRLRGDE